MDCVYRIGKPLALFCRLSCSFSVSLLHYRWKSRDNFIPLDTPVRAWEVIALTSRRDCVCTGILMIFWLGTILRWVLKYCQERRLWEMDMSPEAENPT